MREAGFAQRTPRTIGIAILHIVDGREVTDVSAVVDGVEMNLERDVAAPERLFGEVGLLGEIRGVTQSDLRAREAATLGFRRLIVPKSSAAEIRADVDVVGLRKIEELSEALFAKP